MTIVKPTDALNPGSFRHQWSKDDTFKVASNGRTFPQPDNLKTDKFKYGYKQYVDEFVINKSASVSIAYRSSIRFNDGEVSKAWILSSGYLSGWGNDDWAPADQFTEKRLNSKKESDHPDSLSYVKNFDVIKNFWCDATSVTLSDQFTAAVHFRNVTDNLDDYGVYFETLPEKTTATNSWSPMDENEACSSYSMVVGAKNINRITNETKGCHTIMLYQRSSVPE